MKAYSIFDDFPKEAIEILEKAGVELTIHPMGVARPNDAEMKSILEQYDGVIIGTSQKIKSEMFENINTAKIIATASVGLDHINVPENKKDLVTIFNTPNANAQSVAEFTFGCALACCKRLVEGRERYIEGKDNKTLHRKPEDLMGKIIGVVGAGNISKRIMEFAVFFGMDVICWTKHPENHTVLLDYGIRFVSLEELCEVSDVISVNLPNLADTVNLISKSLVSRMKDTAVFISVSRLQTIDIEALFRKAEINHNFYVCIDIDVSQEVVKRISGVENVMVTPHIAGGTIATRRRMFNEIAEQIAKVCD
jgi:D-3-phosphoglycerate dehydrogenase